jgi:two-component system, chemotaxis family, sensor histidine kinase and response regulator PixL
MTTLSAPTTDSSQNNLNSSRPNPSKTDRAYQIFLQEAPELLQVLEEALLHISAPGNQTQRLNTLMRTAHSIKGCAASMGLSAIESIAHQLEDVFRALYRRKETIDAELAELLIMAFDCLQMPLRQEIDQNTDSTADLNTDSTSSSIVTERDWVAQSRPIFDRLKVRLATEMAADHGELPGMSDLGIDLVQVIFSGDVAQGIQHLVNQIKQGKTATIAPELRAQAEVFIGVGEMTNLPGFRQIGTTVITALNHHPNQGLAIAKLAIQNFRAAYQAVMNGDRTVGGSPSELLLAMSRPKTPSTAKLTFTQPAIPESPITDCPIAAPIASFELPHLSSQRKSPTITPSPQPSQTEITAPILSNVLRVDRYRFDRLSAHIGNLITYENAAKLQQQQLDRILQNIQHRVQQFEKIQLSLQEIHQKETPVKLPIAPRKSTRVAIAQTEEPFSARAVTQVLSDPLQFDTYTPTQNLNQSAIEELTCLKEILQDLTLLSQQQQQQQRKKFHTLRETQNDLLWIRMLPIEQIVQRFPRMVRDLCVKYEKDVMVNLIGTSTLIDKAVLEKLFDPLVHLVRNAFDHGVETPYMRQSHGKSAQATIEIRAYHQGNLTYVEIRDDGNGIDLNKIKTKAIGMGLATMEAVTHLSDPEILEFIFEPGFSTAIQVSELSGRGVGLDAVRENLRSLKGDVRVFSQVGEGTMFRLTFPLTLTIADLLIFRTQNVLLSIPVDSLAGIVMIQAHEVELLEGRSFYRDGDELIEIADLAIFRQHYPLPFMVDTQLQTLALPDPNSIPLVIIEHSDELLALPVTQIIQRQEQVIKPFNTLVPIPDYLCGCTVLGNGMLVPVLDSRELIRSNHMFFSRSDDRSSTDYFPRCSRFSSNLGVRSATILVVDDTLTLRVLLTDSLTKLGYTCVSARDGREALQVLAQVGPVDAIFTDLEMPVMNGFEFLQECRKQYPKAELPIVILSSRNGEKHRKLAHYLGANAYLTKPFLEHQLTQVLTQCVVEPYTQKR